MRPKGPKIEAEGRERGGVLGRGHQVPSPPAGGLWECYELPQRGSGQSPYHQRFSTIFSTAFLTYVDNKKMKGSYTIQS